MWYEEAFACSRLKSNVHGPFPPDVHLKNAWMFGSRILFFGLRCSCLSVHSSVHTSTVGINDTLARFAKRRVNAAACDGEDVIPFTEGFSP